MLVNEETLWELEYAERKKVQGELRIYDGMTELYYLVSFNDGVFTSIERMK